MFTINLEDGREAPSKARKKGAKRLEFLVFVYIINVSIISKLEPLYSLLSYLIQYSNINNHKTRRMIKAGVYIFMKNHLKFPPPRWGK